MANVKTVQDRNKGALLILDDGVKVWTPDKELARTLLGKPIPDDWTRRENENGPMALPPKPRGGGIAAAWRNTKEGFEAEAAGRRRWQEIEEEHKDRRTALMTAAEQFDKDKGMTDPKYLLNLADSMYEWLRSSPAAGPHSGVATTVKPDRAESSGTGVPATPDGQAGDTSLGAVGPRVARPAEEPAPNTSSPKAVGEGGTAEADASGEVAPASAPGEGFGCPSPGVTTSSHDSSGSQTYAVRPENCNHKSQAGRWLPTKTIDGVARCPRCGESALIYRETSA